MSGSKKTIRIFIGSRTDVQKERQSAFRIIERLNRDPFFSDLDIRAVGWDIRPHAAPTWMSPQQAISQHLPLPSACDVAAFMFWSRIGTPLAEGTYPPNGAGQGPTGSLWEFHDALEAGERTGRPWVLTYRNVSQPPFDFGHDEAEFSRQIGGVKKFFEGFRNERGEWLRTAYEYTDIEAFSEKLEFDLRSYLKEIIQPENRQEPPVVEPPPPKPTPNFSSYWSRLLGDPSQDALRRLGDEVRQQFSGLSDHPDVVQLLRAIRTALERMAKVATPPEPRPSETVWRARVLAPWTQGFAALLAAVAVGAWVFLKPPNGNGNKVVDAGSKVEVKAGTESSTGNGDKAPDADWPKALSSFGEFVVLRPGAGHPGCFQMGSPAGQGTDDEHRQHKVCLSGELAIRAHEVTFAQYDRFASATGHASPEDSGWGRGDQPVINVNWRDARAYTGWLSNKPGLSCSLPTDAEWEYAARAGTETPWVWGNEADGAERYAWFAGNSGGRTHPVGTKKANTWGLHDTAGNVSKWVEDCWHKSYEGAPKDGTAWLEGNGAVCGRRVLRGGSWLSNPGGLRSAVRDWRYPAPPSTSSGSVWSAAPLLPLLVDTESCSLFTEAGRAIFFELYKRAERRQGAACIHPGVRALCVLVQVPLPDVARHIPSAARGNTARIEPRRRARPRKTPPTIPASWQLARPRQDLQT